MGACRAKVKSSDRSHREHRHWAGPDWVELHRQVRPSGLPHRQRRRRSRAIQTLLTLISSLVPLVIPLVDFSHVQPLLHPLLSELQIVAVLLNAAALGLPLVVALLGGVLSNCHPQAGVLQWVRWPRLPLHNLVLLLQEDPFGGPGSSDRAHGVRLALLVARWHPRFPKDLRIVERTKGFVQSPEVWEACILMFPDERD